jgi:hypothetical protein
MRHSAVLRATSGQNTRIDVLISAARMRKEHDFGV